jgi:hypothetical protein
MRSVFLNFRNLRLPAIFLLYIVAFIQVQPPSILASSFVAADRVLGRVLFRNAANYLEADSLSIIPRGPDMLGRRL